jgi:protein-S-isoprenylcysteine O-methyltransferase Ste14
MKRVLVLAYGVACYAMFLGVFLYSIGFVGGFLTPTSLDRVVDDPQPTVLIQAILINLALVTVFGLQHSVMARPAFKRWLNRWVSAPMERSTYVLATNLALGLLYWQWRPMGGIVWHVEEGWTRVVLWCLFASGWLTVLATTCLINHFDLFGLRQAWLYFQDRPYTSIPFVTPGPYRFVRHPLYAGWLMAFWATPSMTVAHLLFAAALTTYILLAIRLEERDLVAFHRAYSEYRRRVPMLVPRWPWKKKCAAESTKHVRTRASRSVSSMDAFLATDGKSIDEVSTTQH